MGNEVAHACGPGKVSGTVYEAFLASADRFPDNDMLCFLPQTARHYGIEPQTISYREAAIRIVQLRGQYAAAGLGHGDRAGLLLENRPEMFLHWLALNALGVSVVPINPEWRSAELEYLLAHSEIRVAVAPEARCESLVSAAAASGCGLVVTKPDLNSLAPVIGNPARGSRPDAHSECALLYTSGTTGRPKGCVLTNTYFLWAGSWYVAAGGMCEVRAGQERLISPLPMSHMNAMACSTMAMLLTGGCIIPLDRFHPTTWWDDVRDSRASIIHYLGVMPAMLLGMPATTSDRNHSVRFGFGAGVGAQLHAPFESRFGFPLLEAWAMTETGAGASVIANHEPRKVGTACFGRAADRIEYRIVDESGNDVEAGTQGELWVRSAGTDPRFGFFSEYLKDPAATRAAWEHGYFHTGDIVRTDSDGDFHFVDRRKNVIRRSGENISAVEVEGVLLQHPAIAEAGVTAVPDQVRGDEVFACIVTRTDVAGHDHETLARELVRYCLERLAYFKAPGHVAFCSSLPRTPTQKIQRALLKELASRLAGTVDSIDLRTLKKRTGA